MNVQLPSKRQATSAEVYQSLSSVWPDFTSKHPEDELKILDDYLFYGLAERKHSLILDLFQYLDL